MGVYVVWCEYVWLPWIYLAGYLILSISVHSHSIIISSLLWNSDREYLDKKFIQLKVVVIWKDGMRHWYYVTLIQVALRIMVPPNYVNTINNNS